MTLDRLKKLKGNGDYNYNNPYVNKETQEKKDEIAAHIAEDNNRSLSERQMFYFTSQLEILKNEINDLKMDIISLVMAVENNNDEVKLTALALKEKYYSWRAGKDHAMNKISNKTNAIINKELKF